MMKFQQILIHAEVVDRIWLFLSFDEPLVWILKAQAADS